MLNFVPLVVMSFMILKIESDDYGYWCFVVYGVCNLMFALGTLISIIAEIREMRAKSMRKYWSSPENWFQFSMIVICIVLTVQILLAGGHMAVSIGDRELKSDFD